MSRCYFSQCSLHCAPTGADATNEIFDTWVDGRLGLNNEKVMLSYSTNGGNSWSSPTAISSADDRGYYAAAAISPNGQQLYVGYNAFTTPYRTNTWAWCCMRISARM